MFQERLAAAALLVILSSPLTAQWIHYPTAGVPRTPDGKPNLAAPAPRTAPGRPDISGMWMTPQTTRPCGNTGCNEVNVPGPENNNFGVSLPGGLPYTKWAADLVTSRAPVKDGDDPHVKCLPPTFPRAWALPHITKIIDSPGVIVILDEFNASYRQIFTDGRPLPVDPQPSWNGYSVGQWEGDVLVVRTIGFRDDIWLDTRGSPLTEASKMTERIRRLNFGTLSVDVTVEDSKAYTRPWTVHLSQEIVLDTEMIDEICLENEQSRRHLPRSQR
jgi:hypothetical protein